MRLSWPERYFLTNDGGLREPSGGQGLRGEELMDSLFPLYLVGFCGVGLGGTALGLLGLLSGYRHRRAAVLLLVVGLLTSAGLASQAEALFCPQVADTDLAGPEDLAMTDAPVTARTDTGRVVPLYVPVRLPDDPGALEAYEARLIRDYALFDRLIRVAPADERYNCHGWVFTDGRAYVRGTDVPHILMDNGYQRVSDPQEDDLVVYRDARRGIVHTGVVRAASAGGPLLVESKWGRAGRFVHLPDRCCYQAAHEFYRSARKGHLLNGLDTAFASIAAPSATGEDLDEEDTAE